MTTDNPAFWNALAESYAAKAVEDPNAFERKIAITRSEMEPSDVVLDIGCGTGSLALRLADSAAEVHGLDVSSEMVRIAREKARTARATTVHFHTGPFDETFDAFEPESLDGICAYSLLHLLEDRAEALFHIHRLLKPGGFFVSSTVCLGESWAPYRPLLALMRWLGKAPHVAIVDKATLAREIEEAGFIDLAQPDVGAEATIGFMVAIKPR